MVLRTSPLLLLGLAGCLAEERALVELPLELRLATPPPYTVGAGTITLDEAWITVGDALLRDDRGGVVGDWAHQATVDLLAAPTVLDPARAYEGAIDAGTFRLQGAPAVTLRGALSVGADRTPLDLAPTLDLEPALGVELAPVDATDPRPLAWVVDLSVVLGALAPPVDRPADGTVTADGSTLDELAAGLLSPGAWRLVERDALAP